MDIWVKSIPGRLKGTGRRKRLEQEAICQEDSEYSVVDTNLERWAGAGSGRPCGSWKNLLLT